MSIIRFSGKTLFLAVSLLTTFSIFSQEKPLAPQKNPHDQLAVLYQESVDLLVATSPAFQEAFKKQLTEGKPNDAVASWLKLLELLNGWPHELQRTQKEAKKKTDAMMQELLKKADDQTTVKGAENKTASPSKGP